jgi:hypothetical protein
MSCVSTRTHTQSAPGSNFRCETWSTMRTASVPTGFQAIFLAFICSTPQRPGRLLEGGRQKNVVNFAFVRHVPRMCGGAPYIVIIHNAINHVCLKASVQRATSPPTPRWTPQDHIRTLTRKNRNVSIWRRVAETADAEIRPKVHVGVEGVRTA